MIWYQDIEQFKSYLGGVVAQDMDAVSLDGSEQNAIDKHLIPRIGEDFYLEMKNQKEVQSPDQKWVDLFPYFERALAHLAAYEYVRFGAISISDHGITRRQSDTETSAYKYQEKSLRNYLVEHGYMALEKLLKYLVSNAGDFPTWQSSEEYEATTGHFVNFAEEVQRGYNKDIDRHTFEYIFPIIEDLEYRFIMPYLGNETFDDLLTKIYDPAATSHEKEAIRLIRRCLSAYAVRDGILRNIITLTGNRVMIVEENSIDAFYKTNSPEGTDKIRQRLLDDEALAKRYRDRLINYLNEHEDQFDFYTAPAEEEEDPNGAQQSWSTDSEYSCDDKKNKDRNVVHL